MKKVNLFIGLLTIFFFISSCRTAPNFKTPKLKKEIPIKELHNRGIAPPNSHYKHMYYRLMPYLYWNNDGKYNELQGDFYNVKFDPDSNLNISVEFNKKYGKYDNSLYVLIAMTNTSKVTIRNTPISVISRKHGEFIKGEPNYNEYNEIQQRVLFVKKLSFENKYELLEQIKDDYITVIIGNQKYEFINPELEFD